MNSGFVAYYRTIVEKSWYKDDPVKRFVFEHCLNTAQYSVYESTFHGRTLTLEAGQLHTSYKDFAAKSGVLGFYKHPSVNSKNPVDASKKAVERTLKYFKKDGCFDYKSYGSGNNQTTVITISNWSNFQSGHVPTSVPKVVPIKSEADKGVGATPVPIDVPNSVTKNNNTISKDIVKRSCSEQGSKPRKPENILIDYLNQQAKRKLKHTASDLKFITARLNEKFTVDELKLIVDYKVYEWHANPDMNKYLRPSTLFGTKANGYLAEAQAALDNPQLIQVSSKEPTLDEQLNDNSWANDLDDVL